MPQGKGKKNLLVIKNAVLLWLVSRLFKMNRAGEQARQGTREKKPDPLFFFCCCLFIFWVTPHAMHRAYS